MKPGELNVFPRRTVNSGDPQERPRRTYVQIYGAKALGGTQVRYFRRPLREVRLPVEPAGAFLRAQSGEHAGNALWRLLAPAVALAGLLPRPYAVRRST